MEKIIKEIINDNTFKLKNLEDSSLVIDCGSKFDFHIDLEDAKNLSIEYNLKEKQTIYIIDNYDNITYVINRKNNDIYLDLYKGNVIEEIQFLQPFGSTELI